ncbi:leucyl aminopeptidase [Candidatus Woesearchaeota archaeon CG10_big_fil_rev_8_21_14_0_10_44_13]|nr:MAG: leucyl aminopeptidase [Candidatus Woesearchaeota archaeon CG10_big_fil_rev_8_21_14_0_10_44_13]
MPTLKKSAITTLRQCLALKKHENLLIVADRTKTRIANELFKQGIKLCRNVLLIWIPEGRVNGEEPPKAAAELMKKYDVIICVTQKSLTHTNAVRIARKTGRKARVATMPGITEAIFRRGMSADYKKISGLTDRLKAVLRKAKKLRVTARIGTDITMGRGVMEFGNKEGIIHKKGDLNNLPAGEAAFVPVYRSAEGVFMIDASIDGVGKLDRPIKVTVKNGYAMKIEGGKAADNLRKLLRSCGKEAFNIAELGIGTNDRAKICKNVLEDEKVMGTAHIALGSSKGLGGNIYAKCHLDGVFKKPTIYADGKIIIKEGIFMI